MKKLSNKKQKGFSILAVILVIVAVVVAIGVWALSGQSNTANSSIGSVDSLASAIINDSAAIKLTHDNLILYGANPPYILFKPNTASTTANPNILDPTNGIQSPQVNPNAIRSSPRSTEGYWVYLSWGFNNSGVGTSAYDPTIVVAGVKKTVCERINYLLYGTQTIPSAGMWSNSGIPTTGATPSNPTAGNTYNISTAAAKGWTSGCLASLAGGDDNVYFHVLLIN